MGRLGDQERAGAEDSTAGIGSARYLPGRSPRRDRPETAWEPPRVFEDWPRSAAFLDGVALFNAGWYWEAHEAWESLWQVAPGGSADRAWLQGLIKLAAAGVKLAVEQPRGAARHLQRAAELFDGASADRTFRRPLRFHSPMALATLCRQWLAAGPAAAGRPGRELPLELS